MVDCLLVVPSSNLNLVQSIFRVETQRSGREGEQGMAHGDHARKGHQQGVDLGGEGVDWGRGS